MVMLGHQLHRYLSIGTNFTTCYYLGITLRQSERSLQPNHLRNQPSKISSSLVQELPMSFMRFERQQEHGRQPISCFRRYRRLRRKSINSLLWPTAAATFMLNFVSGVSVCSIGYNDEDSLAFSLGLIYKFFFVHFIQWEESMRNSIQETVSKP